MSQGSRLASPVLLAKLEHLPGPGPGPFLYMGYRPAGPGCPRNPKRSSPKGQRPGLQEGGETKDVWCRMKALRRQGHENPQLIAGILRVRERNAHGGKGIV